MRYEHALRLLAGVANELPFVASGDAPRLTEASSSDYGFPRDVPPIRAMPKVGRVIDYRSILRAILFQILVDGTLGGTRVLRVSQTTYKRFSRRSLILQGRHHSYRTRFTRKGGKARRSRPSILVLRKGKVPHLPGQLLMAEWTGDPLCSAFPVSARRGKLGAPDQFPSMATIAMRSGLQREVHSLLLAGALLYWLLQGSYRTPLGTVPPANSQGKNHYRNRVAYRLLAARNTWAESQRKRWKSVRNRLIMIRVRTHKSA